MPALEPRKIDPSEAPTPGPRQGANVKADIVRFEPKPRPPNLEAKVVSSQFLIEPAPSDLERSRKQLLEAWTVEAEPEGMGASSTWAPVATWVKLEPAATPGARPIFGGAALEKIELPPVGSTDTLPSVVVAHDAYAGGRPPSERTAASSAVAGTQDPAGSENDRDFAPDREDDSTESVSVEYPLAPKRPSGMLWLAMISGLVLGVTGMAWFIESGRADTPASGATASLSVVAARPVEPVEAIATEEVEELSPLPDMGASAAAAVAPDRVPPPSADGVPEPAPPSDSEFQAVLDEAQSDLERSRFKHAVGLYRSVLEKLPNHPQARAGLGISLVLSDGNSKEALAYLQEAVARDGDHSQAWLALGIAFQNLGRDAEARAPYEQFLRLRPSGNDANEVRAALRNLR
jgi:Flp pilus assembly protein TadD